MNGIEENVYFVYRDGKLTQTTQDDYEMFCNLEWPLMRPAFVHKSSGKWHYYLETHFDGAPDKWEMLCPFVIVSWEENWINGKSKGAHIEEEEFYYETFEELQKGYSEKINEIESKIQFLNDTEK
jgi:hypothetical protein